MATFARSLCYVILYTCFLLPPPPHFEGTSFSRPTRPKSESPRGAHLLRARGQLFISNSRAGPAKGTRRSGSRRYRRREDNGVSASRMVSRGKFKSLRDDSRAVSRIRKVDTKVSKNLRRRLYLCCKNRRCWRYYNV